MTKGLAGSIMFEPSPGEFVPAKLLEGERKKYGIPEMPNQATQPRLFSVWKSVFDRPMRLIRPEQEIDRGHSAETKFTHRAAPRPVGLGNETWSGAVLTSSRPDPFNFVAGFWNVPQPYAPTQRRENEYRSSAWVGLDGYGGSPELPQIGTAHVAKVDDGHRVTTETYAWWQWWTQDGSGPPVRIKNLPVSPGDLVFCFVMVISSSRVRVFIQNQSQRAIAVVVDIEPGKSNVSGTTAEWILERPTNPGDTPSQPGMTYPLPEYGSIVFQGAIAGTQNRGEQFLTGVTLLDMYEGRRILSKAVRENRETLRVGYATNGPPP